MKTQTGKWYAIALGLREEGRQNTNGSMGKRMVIASVFVITMLCLMQALATIASAQSGDQNPDGPLLLGITWAQGTPEDQAASSAGLPFPYMTRHGGKIMPKANVKAIFWGGSWAYYTGDKISGIDSWYRGFGNSNYAATSNEYIGSNGKVGSTLAYGGHFIDTSMASGGGNPGVILAEVCKEISEPDPSGNGYYPVYTDVPRGNAGYCAWHSAGTCKGIPVQFAFFFNLDGDMGCDPADTSGLHSQGLDALSNVSGHELSEARTDPALNAWFDAAGNENGDKCAWTFGAPLVTFSNGTQWKIQGEWSNNAYSTGTGYPNRNGQNGCLSGAGPIGKYPYQYDDGTTESSIGVQPPNSSVLWMNGFTVKPGTTTITAIVLTFGRPVGGRSNLVNGQPVTLYLWDDPNGDGNPSDAQVLRSVSGVTANVDTNTFNVFPITPIKLPVGSHFFIGAILTEIGMQVPGSIDLTRREHNSWVRGWGPGIFPDPNNIGATINLDNTSVPGVFMIRAEATP
ncbi:MAG TPA: hypothetical protein VII23_20210 [Terriglobales bacterium]